MPIEPSERSPPEIPAETEEPGCRFCTGKPPSGPLGAASTSRSARRAARSSRRRRGEDRPETVRGVAIGRALRRNERARRAEAGGSGDSPRICSMGVASATLLPNSPTLSEIAPALRRTPSEPRQ